MGIFMALTIFDVATEAEVAIEYMQGRGDYERVGVQKRGRRRLECTLRRSRR